MGNVYNAVHLHRAPWPTSFATWAQGRLGEPRPSALHDVEQHVGHRAVLFWPARPGTPFTVDGSKTPPILLVNETLDAPTPFQNALAVRKHFPPVTPARRAGAAPTTHPGPSPPRTPANAR
jgi:hypothetical protein